MKRFTISAYVISTALIIYSVPDLYSVVKKTIFPAVTDFQVTKKELINGNLWIWGEFVKRRCNFREVLAYGTYYDNNLATLINVEFINDRQEERPPINRVPGHQAFGPWEIEYLSFDEVTLFSRHDCDDELVTTKLIKFEVHDDNEKN